MSKSIKRGRKAQMKMLMWILLIIVLFILFFIMISKIGSQSQLKPVIPT